MKRVEYISNSYEESFKLGKKIGKKLFSYAKDNKAIITLNGNLGAGKTVFVKGLAEGINIDEDITSPTFIQLNDYEGEVNLYHFDLYMVDEIDDFFEMSFYEYIYEGTGIVVIEWANRVDEILKNIDISINIEYINENIRKFIIEYNEIIDLDKEF